MSEKKIAPIFDMYTADELKTLLEGQYAETTLFHLRRGYKPLSAKFKRFCSKRTRKSEEELFGTSSE